MYSGGQRIVATSRCPGGCKLCLDAKFVEEYETQVQLLVGLGAPLIHAFDTAIGVVTCLLISLGCFMVALGSYYIHQFPRHEVFLLTFDTDVTLLVGVSMMLFSPVAFLFEPTRAVCAVQRTLPGKNSRQFSYLVVISGAIGMEE